ncbi:extracellular calcium-sensing receptor-like [Gadus chalcogrammus]|uniref:extracellular calcium-sensing receptor-like n=1 Tax=Gadus chalcogrammus TaxID=1042646 RepID=UPI0024C4B2F6|nr:extracellular calcium-sensing receptor-like [Gadus chalcogrammus]
MAGPVSGSVYQKGDIVIGGLFPVHVRAPQPETDFQDVRVNGTCSLFNQRAYRWLRTMVFAVEEINSDPHLLPNLTLGYLAADTCLAESTTLSTALTMVTGLQVSRAGDGCQSAPAVPVIIGDVRSSSSMVIADTLGVFEIPMVSYLASCVCLSNSLKYPRFFRTMPSDALQARAMAKLLQLLGWSWVGLVSADDDYGRFAIQILMEELRGTGGYREEEMREMVETIKKSSAKVVVTFIIDQDAKALLEEVVRQKITDKQWLANDAWVTYATLSVPQNIPSLAGTLGFALRKAEIPNLGYFLTQIHPATFSLDPDPFKQQLWEALFGCSLRVTFGTSEKPCLGSEKIAVGESTYADVSQLRATYKVYKAVYAIAHAIQDMLACSPGRGLLVNGQCPDVRKLHPSELSLYLRRVNFTTSLGEQLYFDENGDPPASYDILNWHVTQQEKVEFVNVGHFVSSEGSGGQFHIDMGRVIWGGGQGDKVPVSICSTPCPAGTRKAVQKGRPVCCFDCVRCPGGEISNETGSTDCIRCPERFWSNSDRTDCLPQQVDFLSHNDIMGIILSIISVAGAALTAATFTTFFYFRHTPLVRANNSEVSFMLLVSLKLCFLCALAFIGRPVAWSCALRHTLFGISFVLCISCLLSRTVVVLVAFRSTLPGENLMRFFGPVQQRLGISICTLVQVLICVLWLVLAPPHPAERGVRENRGPKIVLECDVGSVVGFGLVLGYIGFLACLCLLLAFLARKLPDNFNEAKLITFSMLIFCAVWVAFVPAYISSPGKYTVAVEIFAILASSYGLLLCIFAPKCFILLLRPERNTKKQLMAR